MSIGPHKPWLQAVSLAISGLLCLSLVAWWPHGPFVAIGFLSSAMWVAIWNWQPRKQEAKE